MPTSDKKRVGTPPLQFRLSEAVLAKLDAIAQDIASETEEPSNRADAVRECIRREYSRRKLAPQR